MKYINFVFFCLVIACCKQQPAHVEVNPGYKLMKEFSGIIQPKTNLRLCAYGINHFLPKEYKLTNDIANFYMSYALCKERHDAVSLEQARCLLVFVVQSFFEKCKFKSGNKEIIRARLFKK